MARPTIILNQAIYKLFIWVIKMKVSRPMIPSHLKMPRIKSLLYVTQVDLAKMKLWKKYQIIKEDLSHKALGIRSSRFRSLCQTMTSHHLTSHTRPAAEAISDPK